MSESVDDERVVRALLEAAGLELSEEQVVAFVRAYPTLRAHADRLHAIPELRDESPALVYRAAFGPARS